MQQALAQSVANGGSHIPHPQLGIFYSIFPKLFCITAERVKANVLAAFVAQHQRAVVMAAALQQAQAAAAQQAKVLLLCLIFFISSFQPPAVRQTLPTRMVPASVQRQMNKSSASNSDERREREPEGTFAENNLKIESISALEPENRNQADIMKKVQMQQQYNAIMNAMHSKFSFIFAFKLFPCSWFTYGYMAEPERDSSASTNSSTDGYDVGSSSETTSVESNHASTSSTLQDDAATSWTCMLYFIYLLLTRTSGYGTSNGSFWTNA